MLPPLNYSYAPWDDESRASSRFERGIHVVVAIEIRSILDHRRKFVFYLCTALQFPGALEKEVPLIPHMTLDSFFYCAPCRLKILVVPLGKVRPSYFSRCLQLLRKYQVTRFEDLEYIAPSGAMLNPATFLQGQLMFDFVTDWEPQYRYLEDFQHWRKLYAVTLFP